MRLLESEIPSMAAIKSSATYTAWRGNFGAQVIICIDVNQCTDAGNEEAKQQAQRIETKTEIDSKLR